MGTSTAIPGGRVRLAAAALAAVCALVAPAVAQARGGDYTIDGGQARHRAQIRAALEASSFDWGVVPARVAIHVVPGAQPTATPGHMWLDPRLLEAGMFSWALVQDEYAHQVDFFLFEQRERALLNTLLGGEVWCHADLPGLPHAAYGCERFTSTLVWSYWPAAANSYRPQSRNDESAAMQPSEFRMLMNSLLSGGEPVVRRPYALEL